MNKGIVVITFDDGRDNNRVIDNILIPNSIPATFFITTGFIEGEATVGKSEPMSMEYIYKISNSYILEIAAHGHHHNNSLEDISLGIKKLNGWKVIEDDKSVGFSSPGSQLTPDIITRLREDLKKMGISYVRISYRIKSFKLLKILSRKASRVIKSAFLYRLAYEDTLMDKGEEWIIYSIPVLHSVTQKQLKSVIDYTVRHNKLCVLMFHSINKKGHRNYRDNWSWDYDSFMEICKYILELRKVGALDIKNLREAVKLL